ncbi:MAG: hypothetical protein JNL21_01570 [Myxococcales bacterium]|nr:hypothetical protein [Myxococcales bacterium]
METVERFAGAQGETLEVWAPAPGVLTTRIVGHGTTALTRTYVQIARRQLDEHAKLRVFHDWFEMTGYDPEARDLIRAFGKTNTDDRVLVRYLVKSKIVSMAVQTAALVLGREFEATTDKEKFARWVATAVEASRRGREPPR